MPPPLQPWAYENQPCPKRQVTGASHEINAAGHCHHCGARLVKFQKVQPPEATVSKVVESDEEREPEVARRGDWPKIARVPNYLKKEYFAAREGGIDDEYAQGLVAKQHGLEPQGRNTWTLRTLARLEFLRWLAARKDFIH